MSIGKDGSQRPVPTLTEVVQLPAEAAGAGRNPTNPVVTPTFRQVSRDDSRKVGLDAGRNRLSTALPPPTLPPVLTPGTLPVASSPIAMPSAMFAAAVPKPRALRPADVVRERAALSEPAAPPMADTADWPDLAMPASVTASIPVSLPAFIPEPLDEPAQETPLDDSVLPPILELPTEAS
ncbi:MAG: hypothetical protein JWQ11_3352, partial [Rhizobacter sp.]|nr:hypothetical protein [Rhizobacter sp.]